MLAVMMRVEYAELSSRDLLLESIARAAFEATEMSFDFSTACLEQLGRGSDTKILRTDADCRRVRGAAGLRVTTGKLSVHSSPSRPAARTAPQPVDSLLHSQEDACEVIL